MSVLDTDQTCPKCGWTSHNGILHSKTCKNNCNCGNRAGGHSFDCPYYIEWVKSVITSESGVNRSPDTGKPRYDLVDLGLFRRCALHMAANVASKGENNWRNASTEEDLKRFRASAFRHFIDWFEGNTDEDHAAALVFNVGGAEYVREKIQGDKDRT